MRLSDSIDTFARLLQQLSRRRTFPRLPLDLELLAADDSRRHAAAFIAALAKVAPSADSVLAEPGDVPGFFRAAIPQVRSEIATRALDTPDFAASLQAAATDPSTERVWSVTFPEGVGLLADREAAVAALRRTRRVEITSLSGQPIVDPIAEVLFTANVLVDDGGRDFSFDHPIPMDTPAQRTELAHGLLRLDEAVGFELDRHPGWWGPLAIALSVSTTSREPTDAPIRYVERVVRDLPPLRHLRVFVFDESRARSLRSALGPDEPGGFDVLGVSGEYGRHYSFLKAIAAVWSVCVDARVRATFKIDLDQSFPQRELVAATGMSAFESFLTADWGAAGVGANGAVLDLGLIAGGLVNAADVASSVFTPDVRAGQPASGEDVFFWPRLPQAISTEAEICAPAGDPIERVHVTGGVNGVRVDTLRRWRLFTPTFFGRAEDQAYILSGLGAADLRPAYLHAASLRMRHDKTEIIPNLLGDASGSNHIGDLIRTRLFSALAMPHKALLDPFTGAFASHLPITMTTLRMALFALERAPDPDLYLTNAVRRLAAVDAMVGDLPGLVAGEEAQWNALYDRLDEVEAGVTAGNPRSGEIAAAVRDVVADAEVRLP
ncbi:MAG: hypothetical protein QNJ75_06435 [Acidimicrobiia bacterium]|nr:hypothetical protein [Acidimicrobiia bacterium]